MDTITKRAEVRKIIAAQRGKFFTAIFNSKQDGTVRKVNGRTGVRKYSKGGINVIQNKDDLISAYNVQKKGYRSVFIDGLVQLRAGGKVYNFED